MATARRTSTWSCRTPGGRRRSLPFVEVTAQMADDPSIKDMSLQVDVRDNLTDLLARYVSTGGVSERARDVRRGGRPAEGVAHPRPTTRN